MSVSILGVAEKKQMKTVLSIISLKRTCKLLDVSGHIEWIFIFQMNKNQWQLFQKQGDSEKRLFTLGEKK